MQNTNKKRGDYGNNNSWSTVSRKNKKKQNNKRKENEKNYTNSRRPSDAPKPNNRYVKPVHVPEYPTDVPKPNNRYVKPVHVPEYPTDVPKPDYKITKNKYVQHIRNYADIILKPEHNENTICSDKITNDTNNSVIIPIRIPSYGKRQTVRNQVPKINKNVSYHLWEYTYFQHILDLKAIFSKCSQMLDIDINTVNFLDIFSHFIRDNSSGHISPYIEHLNENSNHIYSNFTTLRNEFLT